LSRFRDAIARWAAAVLLLAAAPAPGAGAEPAVTLRARPASLVLGTAARATIEIDAGGGGAPHVTTNVGRIENLRAVDAGRFEADYVPPREAYPQVAIVAAVVGERYGWTSIPLSGRGVATARSAPHAAVRVTIGGESFGPVRTDWSGEARVQVIAPPGERFAFHRDRPLDLNVPPTVHVHVAAGRLVAPADAEQRLPLYVFAVTAAGAPRAGAPVVLDVSQGTIVDRAERASGEIVATWRLAPGAAQPATATVRLADEPGPKFAVTVARPGGAPARVTLVARPSRVVAGEEAPVALRVRVVDGAGNPAAAVPRIESDFGEVSAPVSAGDAAWEARLGSHRRSARGAASSWWRALRDSRIASGSSSLLPTRRDSSCPRRPRSSSRTARPTRRCACSSSIASATPPRLPFLTSSRRRRAGSRRSRTVPGHGSSGIVRSARARARRGTCRCARDPWSG
jgi:hypothetical protein